MSTKALEDMIDSLRVDGAENFANAAQAELSAIRAAATVLAAEARGEPYSESDRGMAMALMAEIAKEEP